MQSLAPITSGRVVVADLGGVVSVEMVEVVEEAVAVQETLVLELVEVVARVYQMGLREFMKAELAVKTLVEVEAREHTQIMREDGAAPE